MIKIQDEGIDFPHCCLVRHSVLCPVFLFNEWAIYLPANLQHRSFSRASIKMARVNRSDDNEYSFDALFVPCLDAPRPFISSLLRRT